MIPNEPSPLQLQFLGLDAEEALFGGAAGAGKSEVMLLGALQFVHVPGFAAAIFRRTKVEAAMADTPGARLAEWLKPAIEAGLCRWDDHSSSYVFPTKGADATIHLGYMQSEADEKRYVGAAWQYIAVDEITQWTEDAYLFLFSRLRYSSTIDLSSVKVPLRMRATTNPGGPGHEWVKARFIEYARHLITKTDARKDMRRRRDSNMTVPLPQPPVYVSPPSAEATKIARELGRVAQGAHFVPGFVEDNPAMKGERLASYLANLARLRPAKYARLRWGDWDATGDGGFFTEASFSIVQRTPMHAIKWIRSYDFAATVPEAGKDPDWTVGAKMSVFDERVGEGKRVQRVCVSNVVRGQWSPTDTDRVVARTANRDGRRVIQLFEQEPGAAGKRGIAHLKTTILPGYIVKGMRKTGPKEEYWEALASVTGAEQGQVVAETPMLLVRESDTDEVWIKAFIAELTSVPDGHDDQADAASQGYAFFTEKLEGLQRLRAQVGG